MAPAKRTFLVVIAAIFLATFIWLGIYPHEASRIFLNHRRAVLSMRSMGLAERAYAAQHPDAGYVCNLGDLGQLGLVDRLSASGTRNGYHFEIRCPQDGGQEAMGYTITAVPVSPGMTGNYALCTDQSGQVWYSENGLVSDCFAMRKLIERKYE